MSVALRKATQQPCIDSHPIAGIDGGMCSDATANIVVDRTWSKTFVSAAMSTCVVVAALTKLWPGDLSAADVFSLCMAIVSMIVLFVNLSNCEHQCTSGTMWTWLALFSAALARLAHKALALGDTLEYSGFFMLIACMVVITWLLIWLKSARQRQWQINNLETDIKVMSESQSDEPEIGPALPPGVAVGDSMIRDVWETRFRNNEFGQALEWVAGWSAIAPIIRPHLRKDGRVLQVGCGNSNLAAELHSEGYVNVWSIDISPTAIVNLKLAHAMFKELTYETMDATKMDFSSNFFDAIIDKGTLEAIPMCQHHAYLNEVGRVLRPGGKFVVLTSVASVPGYGGLDHRSTNELTREDKSVGEIAWAHVFMKT